MYKTNSQKPGLLHYRISNIKLKQNQSIKKQFHINHASYLKSKIYIYNHKVVKHPTNCLSVFDHFVGLALKGLKYQIFNYSEILW